MLDEHVDITEAIEAEVAKAAIDLVVMASHGRGNFQRYWLGSVGDDVYRTSSVPVLIARPQEKAVDFEHEPQIRRIAVALDGSTQAEAIMESAMNFSQSVNADLILVRVISPSPEESEESAGEVRSQKDPARYLQDLAEKMRLRGARVHTRLLVSADPAEAIIEAAAGADLIAMQTHARRGVSRLVRGSIVHKVVHDSTVPVLITRPHK
jgi:nucleotide-binding universal stress UspA family protein